MSATNRGAKREEQDSYQTPKSTIELFYKGYTEHNGAAVFTNSSILEPCAGIGNFLRVMPELFTHSSWTVGDIREECREYLEGAFLFSGMDKFGELFIGDYLKKPTDGPFRYDYCITNPPFSLAMEFIEKCNRECKKTIMLLRINFLGSKKRAAFFKEHCPDVYVLSKRPSFTKGKTDSTEYGFFVWNNENPRPYGKLVVLGY